jgi:hypothetical protein
MVELVVPRRRLSTDLDLPRLGLIECPPEDVSKLMEPWRMR